MPQAPLRNSSFTLDTSGVAGFFGGEEAVSAMATVHIYSGRKWLGWYNSPGSYTVARHYGKLAKSKLWRGLYPGAKANPIELFELGGKKGPEYVAAHSGTVLKETGYLAHLLMGCCGDVAPKVTPVEGRETVPIEVTIAKLSLPQKTSEPVAIRSIFLVLLALVPIASSIGTCVLCAFYDEWPAFTMILWGILANGISCFTVGSGKLTVKHISAAPGAPRGDGFLTGSNKVLVLLGEENSVNLVTRGSFVLEFPEISKANHDDVGVCSLLLTTQFILQLLLTPQSHLFGQLMFLASLAVAWVYNSYLSSFDREHLQSSILFSEDLLNLNGTSVARYRLGTRTSMSVFVVLVLNPADPRKILDRLLPNDTEVWEAFKTQVSSQIQGSANMSEKQFHCEVPQDVRGNDGELMRTLCSDANEAYRGYCVWRVSQRSNSEWPSNWSEV